jgi:D-alanyl-D-alanine carboxypeptidase
MATLLCLLVSFSSGASGAASADEFFAKSSRISPALKARMKGKSWHKGCPVPIKRLRLLRLSYHGFDGERHVGRLVLNKDAVDAVTSALETAYEAGFKIHRMYLVDRYDAKDRRSMRADNTSAFNCRYVAGTTSWSQHAYGRAIDINPVENPYVSGDHVSPRKGRPYADRSRHHKGMIHRRGATAKAFKGAGWGWGGNWSSAKDYQHFSSTGT